MVGQVFTKSECCALILNSTKGADGTALTDSDCEHVNGTDFKELSQCRLGYVMAVTMMVGIYQVFMLLYLAALYMILSCFCQMLSACSQL